MDRRGKPKKVKANAKRPLVRKSPKDPVGKVRDLEKRLAEALEREADALKREAEALAQFQTRNHELVEAQEQQTATSEILRVMASSPTDVQPVFDAIADSAVRLCDAAFSGVFRFDGERIHFVAHAGLSAEELAAARAIFPLRTRAGGTGLARVMLDRTVVHIPDIRTDAEWQASAPSRSLNPLAGYRTFLAVPLIRNTTCLGAINVWRREVSPFSEQQISLLRTFADQAVIAIENVRLFKQLEEKNRALSGALEQ
jgi:GAF domain-containing protein